ncbi:VCBS repeat-containing protein [Arenibacter latericius]|uniref:VCBS repeat-containing protein n=1 Tax=Arenibacter latericius TaxID=86104 RepID=UPI0003FD4950|nr:VCBS repeat-containing protein [Arenibacter latericius]
MKCYFLIPLYFIFLLSCTQEKEVPSNINSPLFELRTNSGINFQNELTYTEDFNPYTYRNFYNGGGVAIGDINNDGLPDIYFTGNMVDNKLYLNKGNWEFADITDLAGVACKDVWSTGATFVDINNDGLLDLYVCKSGKPGGANRHNELFINNGDLTFTEMSAEYGLDIEGLSVHAAFFDFDKDGDLDCYILNNSIKSVGAFDLIKDQRNIPSATGNKLLRNDNGKFVDISSEAGIYTSGIGFGLGITLSDFNGDSWPDLFISNDFFERDYLYLNNQKGGFDEVAEEYISSFSMGSMGADAGDLNNDLMPDIMVTEMLPSTIERQRTKAIYDSWDKYSLMVKQGYANQFPRNVLQRNMGEDGFYEIGRYAGVSATDWSWASLIFDMDNDGLRDIFIGNGIYKDLLDRDYLTYMANEEKVKNMMKTEEEVIMKLIDLMPSQAVPNAAFINKGDFRFINNTDSLGLGTPSFSNGSAYADLDNDGDLDLVVNNVNMPAFIYENKTDTTTHKSVYINFKSNTKNTKAIGAKAIIYYGDDKRDMAENFPSRGFQSSVNHGVHFGMGSHDIIDSLKIIWPNGATSKEVNLDSNKTYTFLEPDLGNLGVAVKKFQNSNSLHPIQPLFNFTHKENNYVDFNRERLLPQMFNNEGPAMATADINGDGVIDVYIGGAKNQPGSLFLSIPNSSGYTEIKEPFLPHKSSEDTYALFFDSDNDGDLDLYVSSGGKAFSTYDWALNDRLYINDGNGNFTISPTPLPFTLPLSTSTVQAVDIDNDGDLDLFIGGRFNPQTYGSPVTSYILENLGQNKYALYNAPELENIGMVTDAAWVDINQDGWQDLIVVGEWMPIKIFINEEGKFIDQTASYGLSNTTGMWSTLKIADINGNGKKDILAGNIGQNSFYKPGTRLYLNDFDRNGFAEQIICHKLNDNYYPIVDRDELIAQLPELKNKLLFYKDYAKATMTDIFEKEHLDKAYKLDLQVTASSLFLNNGDHFIQKELPPEIQYSNVSAIAVMDINKDGVMDILLGGNQYLVKPQFGRLDASKGWMVIGQSKEENDFGFGDVKPLGIPGQIRGFQLIPYKEKQLLLTAINNNDLLFHEVP